MTPVNIRLDGDDEAALRAVMQSMRAPFPTKAAGMRHALRWAAADIAAGHAAPSVGRTTAEQAEQQAAFDKLATETAKVRRKLQAREGAQ